MVEILNKYKLNFEEVMPASPESYLTIRLKKAMEEYALNSRIQERKNHIYVLEQDLLDNGPEGEGIYSEDYRRCITDEIANHTAYIEDLETELNKLTNNI